MGGDPEGKIHLLMDYTDRPGQVADPWYTGDFETTYQDVLEGVSGLAGGIKKKDVKKQRTDPMGSVLCFKNQESSC